VRCVTLWKYRWQSLLAVVLLLLGGVLAVDLIPLTDSLSEMRWSGGYDLTVHLDTPAGPPSVVLCAATGGRRDQVEEVVAILRTFPASTRLTPALDIGGRPAVADPFVGGPLKVPVRMGGRSMVGESPVFGRHISRDLSSSQEGFLVVGADWPDGRREWKVVEIPDGRVSREVRVSLP
jgi:hypothetical protein